MSIPCEGFTGDHVSCPYTVNTLVTSCNCINNDKVINNVTCVSGFFQPDIDTMNTFCTTTEGFCPSVIQYYYKHGSSCEGGEPDCMERLWPETPKGTYAVHNCADDCDIFNNSQCDSYGTVYRFCTHEGQWDNIIGDGCVPYLTCNSTYDSINDIYYLSYFIINIQKKIIIN